MRRASGPLSFPRLLVVTLAASGFACGACGGTKNAPKTDATTTPSASVSAPVASAVADAGDDAAPDAEVALAPPPLRGMSFDAQVRTLFRVAACGGDDPVPAAFDKDMVDAHCKELLAAYDGFKKDWMDVAMPFLARIVPGNSPKTVVYPFGGGDLLGGLATYPNGTEFTTISLETASDIRKIDQAKTPGLKPELARYRAVLGKYFAKAHSRTDNLDIGTKSILPGEIVFDLVALALHGYEPIALRYFTFEPDGSLKYVEQADVDAADAAVKAHKKKPEDLDATLFSNMELHFRKKGDAKAPIKVLRHVAQNLDDDHLKADGRVVKHLEGKGPKVATMTKAASHLLWSDAFSIIRNYLATHTDFMISDSTGFPPSYAKKMGFVQDTYGSYTYSEPFGLVDNKNMEDLRKLFLANPHTDVPFRYGYPDDDHKGGHHGHILVSRKPDTGAAPAASADAGK